ncbi:unnamed protein product [Camellia sinensis]
MNFDWSKNFFFFFLLPHSPTPTCVWGGGVGICGGPNHSCIYIPFLSVFEQVHQRRGRQNVGGGFLGGLVGHQNSTIHLSRSQMAELGQLTSWGKKKRVLVKCEGSSSTGQLSYEKNFCLCVSTGEEMYNPSEWYMVNLSSNKDKKEEEEEKARFLLPIPSSEIRGAYMAFCHEQHHQGEDPPILSPFMKLNKFCSYSASCAVVGSTIYRIGGDHRGGNLKGRWSRKVRFLDTNRPDEGWKRGLSTLCGRSNTPVLSVNGKLYVFGGHHPADIPGVWGEFLDTTTGEWNPLPNPPPSLLPPASLASLHFFAAPLTGEYSDKILVCSKLTKALCLYDVEKHIWECLGPPKCGRFLSTPIVVLTTIYWINF